jgi:hypothetical protein
MINPDSIAPSPSRLEEISRYVAATPQELLDRERFIATRRNPAYSFLGPIEITREYARSYREVYVRAFGTSPQIDETVAPEDEHWPVLVEMRQAADRFFSVKYGRILELAVSTNTRAYKRLATPGAFRNLDEHIPFMRKMSGERKRHYADFIVTPAPAPFQRAADAGLPTQAAYRRMLLGLARLGFDWASVVDNKVRLQSVLSMDEVKGALSKLPGDELRTAVDQIKFRAEYHIGEPTDHFIPLPHELVEGCYGLPMSQEKSECATCPLRTHCKDLANDLARTVPSPGVKVRTRSP